MTPAARAVTGVLIVATVLLSLYLLVPRDYYTGTNSVRTRGTLIELNHTSRTLCLPGIFVPKGTGRMEVQLDTGGLPRGPLGFTLDSGGHHYTDALPAGPGGLQKVDFAFPKTTAGRHGEACIRLTGAGKVFFGGVPGIVSGEPAPEVDGKPVDNRAAIWYRPPAGETSPILFHLSTMFKRVSLFKPSWTGPWFYWLLFLIAEPLLVFAGLRLLLTPERSRRLPIAVLVGLIGLANAAAWAHTTPAFNSPDESEHFAYVQSLAERGKPLDAVQSARPDHSSQESLALTHTRISDSDETQDGKPPWLPAEQRAYKSAVAAAHPSRSDGGGYATAGSVHSPLFYSLGVPFYALAGTNVLNELVAVRLVSAILGGIVAMCAVLLLLELAPGRRQLAVAAGLAVAFQPMFAFMSGSVNNDMGVNAAAAVVTLLAIRLVRRGFAWPTAVGLGVAAGLAPVFKATGYAVYPGVVLAVALTAWRGRARWRTWLPGMVAVLGALLAVVAVWGVVSGLFDRTTFTTPGGGAPGEGAAALSQKGGAVTYIWQIFLPSLPGMTEHWTQSWPAFDIYGLRGWGAFGWYAISWPHIVYWVIMILMVALTALGLSVVVRRLPVLRSRVPETLVLLALVSGTILVMTAAYYSPTPQGDLYPIQGRYVLPAITSLAALFFASTQGLGKRFAGPVAVGLSTSVVCLGYASLWLMLSRFYFAL